jgi:hypothetical protein
MNAIAHKDDGRVEVGGLLPGLVLGYNLCPVGEVDGLALGGHERKFRLVLDGMHSVERDALKVGAVVARRLNASQGKLRGNVLGGQLAAAHAGAAALEQVEREKAHVGANLFGVDGSSGSARGRRQAGNLWNRISGGLLGANEGYGRNACGHDG